MVYFSEVSTMGLFVTSLSRKRALKEGKKEPTRLPDIPVETELVALNGEISSLVEGLRDATDKVPDFDTQARDLPDNGVSHQAPCMLSPASTCIRIPVMLVFFANITNAATQSSMNTSCFRAAADLSDLMRSSEYLSP